MLRVPAKVDVSSSNINRGFREDANETLGYILKHAIALAAAVPEEIVKSCLSCEFFNEQTEICRKANARPPARVIAFGCEMHLDKDVIPF